MLEVGFHPTAQTFGNCVHTPKDKEYQLDMEKAGLEIHAECTGKR